VAVGARIGWGWLSDRAFGGDRRPAMAIIAVLCGLSSFGLAFLQSGVPLAVVIVPVITMGMSAIGWNGLYITSISELAGQHAAGTALGISMTVSQMAVIVVPPLFGLLADRAGAYQPAWLALGVFVLLMTSAIYRTKRWAAA
jgi:MFS family permease